MCVNKCREGQFKITWKGYSALKANSKISSLTFHDAACGIQSEVRLTQYPPLHSKPCPSWLVSCCSLRHAVNLCRRRCSRDDLIPSGAPCGRGLNGAAIFNRRGFDSLCAPVAAPSEPVEMTSVTVTRRYPPFPASTSSPKKSRRWPCYCCGLPTVKVSGDARTEGRLFVSAPGAPLRPTVPSCSSSAEQKRARRRYLLASCIHSWSLGLIESWWDFQSGRFYAGSLLLLIFLLLLVTTGFLSWHLLRDESRLPCVSTTPGDIVWLHNSQRRLKYAARRQKPKQAITPPWIDGVWCAGHRVSHLKMTTFWEICLKTGWIWYSSVI